MMIRTTISLDPALIPFLDTEAGNNRSAYINRLLKEEKRRRLAEAFAQANREEAQDEELQEEFALWDVTLMDGLE